MQTHKKRKARILSLVLSAVMVTTMIPMSVFAAEGDTEVTFSALTANGTANNTDTTELTLTFDMDIANFAETDINIIGADVGTLTKESATGVYTLTISNITLAQGGSIKVEVEKTGFTFAPSNRYVVVNKAPTSTPVAFSALTANGEANTTDTTELTLTFDKDVANLAVADITVTGAGIGTLTKESGTGVYKLAISNITVAEGGNVTVTVAKTGFAFTPASKTVAVHKAASGGLAHDISSGSLTLPDNSDTCSEENPHIVTGSTTSNTITVEGHTHFIKLDGVEIDVSGTANACALDIQGNAEVYLVLEGNNTLKSGSEKAGLQVVADNNGCASVSISGDGALTAIGGNKAAGIGASFGKACGGITIGDGTITAIGGGTNVMAGCGAGIGGAGISESESFIAIKGGNVTAIGAPSASAIGGGCVGGGTDPAVNIKIYAAAKVTAISNSFSATAINAASGSIAPNNGTAANVLMLKYKEKVAANTKTSIKGSSGNTVVEYSPTQEYNSIAFTLPTTGNYTVYKGASAGVQQKAGPQGNTTFAVQVGLASYADLENAGPAPDEIIAQRTKALDFTATSIEKQADTSSWGNPTTTDIDALATEGWKWEYQTLKLTLNGLNAMIEGDVDETFAYLTLPAGTTIVLADKSINTIDGTVVVTGPQEMAMGIRCGGTITVIGNGSLSVTAPEGRGSSTVTNCYGLNSVALIIGGNGSNPTVTCIGGKATATKADSMARSLGIHSVVDINGGTLTAKAGTAVGPITDMTGIAINPMNVS